jgi:hypothetical protein
MRVQKESQRPYRARDCLCVYECVLQRPSNSLSLRRIPLERHAAFHLPDAGEARADGEEPHGAPAPPPHKVHSAPWNDLLIYRPMD